MTDDAAAPTSSTIPGLDLTGRDTNVRPQDDFFRAWNGSWLSTFQIPADKADYASFTQLHDTAQEQLKAIIEDAASQADAGEVEPDSITGKIATLYRDYLDTERLNELGLSPIAPLLAEVDAIEAASELPALFGRMERSGVSGPLQGFIHQDNHDSTRYLLDLRQGGISLPDRDYYLEDKHREALDAYRAHVARMWELAGLADEGSWGDIADRIVGLETALATIQWDSVRNRDPHETYNLVDVGALDELAPALRLSDYLTSLGVIARVNEVNIGQPDFFTGVSGLLATVPLADWKLTIKWWLVASSAALLTQELDDANFAFYGTTLRGIPTQRPRWKRAVDLAQSALSEALGQLYVERHFPPQNKERMIELVDNLLAAYAQSIDQLEWMTETTKAKAHEKLATFRAKIGYPDDWRDYSALEIIPGDLVGNVMRATGFEHDREVAKLGGPIDRDEWFMPPQMVNAYYNPEMNEIVFPAAILQPPFFNAQADDAINYGAIGAVIGHEISHGFDDKGSQYDGLGNLVDWWTDEDRNAFAERTNALVAQYAEYEPVAGHCLNGELTLGENIADVSGVAVALRAYHHSLAGEPGPVIGGQTADQRFFASYAQVWRAKAREEEHIRRVAMDPHSPPEFRVTGVLVNSDEFVEAFDVNEGDAMWRDPTDRVRIW